MSVDTKGNIGIQVSGLGGVTVGTPALSLVGYKMITNASTIYELEGAGTQIGGSFSQIIPYTPISAVVGGEFNIWGDVNSRAPKSHGVTIAAGIGLGEGGEGHVEWGETDTIFSCNVFEIWDYFYKEINKK